MKIEKMASVPLVLHDPYFSIWSAHDKLYDGDTTHWCGKKQRMNGYIAVNGKTYCFMGNRGVLPVIEQVELEVTATRTIYRFEGEEVKLEVIFCSPLLLEDPILVSRPCTYVDFRIEPKKAVGDVKIYYIISEDLVSEEPTKLCGGVFDTETFSYAVFGKTKQSPLNHSGDHVTIDWGNCYIATAEKNTQLFYDEGEKQISACVTLGGNHHQATLLLAFDDLQAINYFGDFRKAYWTTKYSSILTAMEASFQEHEKLMERCIVFDEELEKDAIETIGEEYAFLCNASYRHAIAAHKLITDTQGNLLFLSKENDSNGCIGTVDISYPSSPLFLMHHTEYVKGMLRPIFKFVECNVWEYDFAPHDVGRYPHATGQVYGLNEEYANKRFSHEQGDVFPHFFMYPKGTDLYDHKYQMPVEECGNMLILMAVVCQLDQSIEFAKPHMEVLQKWTKYLLKYGADPGEQLCTDDFAGHLSHNVNLSAKAIMGIEAFALLSKQEGDHSSYQEYHQYAVDMAKDWEKRAEADGHTRLTFEDEHSWSLKYNLIWDIFFDSKLFSEHIIKRELGYYVEKQNVYGVPLDSRKEYTKSDWILWCAAMSGDKEQRRTLIKPIADYLENSPSRVAFSDWYETVSGETCSFWARSVQGGIFMPMWMDKIRRDK